MTIHFIPILVPAFFYLLSCGNTAILQSELKRVDQHFFMGNHQCDQANCKYFKHLKTLPTSKPIYRQYDRAVFRPEMTYSEVSHTYDALPLNNLQSPNTTPPKTLLGLWQPEDLSIQVNDKQIIPLRPADHKPPQHTKTDTPLPKLGQRFFYSIRRVHLPEAKKMLALTFDLCEKANERTGYDSEIVSFLREQQIAATFFAGGKWLRSHEDNALQLMADSHFELANHGWTHGNLRVLTGQKMREQIVWTQAEYQRIWRILERKATTPELKQQVWNIPSQPLLMRFPFGTCSPEALQTANGLGLSAIQWDVVSGDPARGLSVAALKNNVLKSARSGSIVVFHANGRGHNTAKALPGIVKALKEKGFEFVTVSQLLKEGTPETVNECYELHPGDNLRYDALFGVGTE